ncbi:MAG: mechanosensitive ion channel, partial [Desulfobacterales bacterium]
QKPAFYLRVLISMIRWFSIGYIFILWVADSNTTVQTVWRLAFEISLYGWNLFFWSVVHKRQKTGTTPWTPRAAAVINSIKLLSFFIVLTALILELSGYGLLAVYWLTSWTRSTVVILASILLLLVLLEWNPRVKKAADASFDAAATPKKSIRWAMVQFLVLVWFGSSVILLVFAWGGKQAVLLKIFDFLQHTYQVGTMRFSLMGLIVAVLILLLTQAVSRIWQHVFRKNILSQSGMEEGLQDSITTISVYAVWSVGILIALNAFGFNATSLTVVLGALGVGLGFGLQAIFNNFVSGIILLFERPIQVGDDIEVNGLWAQVRKINVRATVVQTYDNASIIIPNSDLISSQVTNWSFKDKRLRRNVAVGVAYGSDVELVRDTLLEVVDKTPRILKLPKPDVVFKDFGDSALIFMVRFWTRVEYFYSVETDVRFAIDRLFRERNIEIAFPQQDIHIRSGFDQKKPVILEKGAPVGVAESGKTDENPA